MQPNYPQPQAYPQQGYAPQPQYAPPQYPQAPPAPQYAPPQPQGYPQQAPPAVPQFHAPAPPQASITRPRLKDFARDNRLVLIKPIRIERGVPNTKGKPGETQDRMTADVIVLDGPPIPMGGKPEEGQPHTTQAVPPYEIVSMFISSAPLISQIERRMGEYVLGRLSMRSLPNGNTAYRLSTDANEADNAIATQFLVAKVSGQLAPPAEAPQAPPAAPQYAPQAPVQQSAPPAQQAYPQPQYAPQAPPQAPAAGMQGPPPGYTQVAVPQQPQWAPPAAQLDIDTPPPTVDPTWWSQQPAEYRQMMVAQSQSRPGV